MNRRQAAWTAAAMGAVLALYAPMAAAQTVDDRYLPVTPSARSLWSLFSPAAPKARAPAPASLPAQVPLPRPVHRTASVAESARPTARLEELMVTAYNPPTAAATEQNFHTWLPRLVSSFDPPPPPAEAFVPATPRPPADLAPRPLPVALPGVKPRPVSDELAALIAAKAHKHGVPIDLAHAVVTVESNYNPLVTGRGATLGLMQIKHATARGLGFAGSAQELYDPATNLEWGMRYLGLARRLAHGDLCGTILRYQAGHRAVAMTQAARDYCAKVRYLLDAAAARKRFATARRP